MIGQKIIAMTAGVMSVMLVLLLVHTPLMVYLTSHFDAPAYIKGWKEGVLAVVFVIVLAAICRSEAMRRRYFTKKSIVWCGVFLASIVPASFINWGGWSSYGMGVLLLARYVVAYMTVVGLVLLYPKVRTWILGVLCVLAVGVLGFALLQQFILDRHILTGLGYGQGTVLPYQLVDQDEGLLRVNSTLRGPNPLGAFAVIAATFALAYILLRKDMRAHWVRATASVMALAGGAVAVFSYSRAAALALLVSCGFLVYLSVSKKIRMRLLALGCVLAVIGGGLLWSTGMAEKVILHDNPAVQDELSSNTDHAESLAMGMQRLLRQPFGAGIGSTGSASDVSTVHAPLYIENQYLHIAHEVGWLGLAAYIGLLGSVLLALWRQRTDWVASAALCSGVGLLLIGIFLPVFQDDVVSIVWWCLAAIGVASSAYHLNKKQDSKE